MYPKTLSLREKFHDILNQHIEFSDVDEIRLGNLVEHLNMAVEQTVEEEGGIFVPSPGGWHEWMTRCAFRKNMLTPEEEEGIDEVLAWAEHTGELIEARIKIIRGLGLDG